MRIAPPLASTSRRLRGLAALALAAFGAHAAFGQASSTLEAFRMPWNDTDGGITSLQSWQPGEAGAAGRVSVSPDGHYQVGGLRVRFLGVDITGADAFPTHASAEVHAARLARFGFNVVRFHHMDAQWLPDQVVIDYSKGNSRTLSADRLDRLHYFVAQLASRGVYSNINLLTGRGFTSADGLGAEIAQMPWKNQHVLGFFVDDALALHKEYATELLSAPNPYRGGRSLAEDPAVAFVEIMNENGLLQNWYSGVLDSLPARYAAALGAKWNAWLKAKYGSTAALLSGWGAIDQPLGASEVTNGDFSAGTASWNFEQHEGAVAGFSATSDFNGGACAKVVVATPGTAGWHVQLNQAGLPLARNGVYTVSFWAKCIGSVPLNATVQKAYPDYASFTEGLSLTLDSTWREYSWSFQSAADESNARVNFGGFGDRAATVWIAGVRLQPGGRIGGLPAGASLEAANVPVVRLDGAGGAVSLGERRDWFACLLDLERGYWTAMCDHVKNTLGFKGLVWGSIIANSPPNVQAGFDATDSHAYWQHPTWPAGLDWDPVQWTIGNVSMANSPGTATLGTLALQRVEGRPHNVTEYQHPSPNSYAAEGPLLAAAYGALQDWDSLYFFEYLTGNSEYISGFFDHGGHPGRMANNLLAAAIFRRGDVSRARRGYTLAFSPDTELSTALSAGHAWGIADGAVLGVPATLAFASRVSLSIGAAASGLTRLPAAPSGDPLVSDTGELAWDTRTAGKGVVTVDTPLTKAVVGFASGRSFALGGVDIAPGSTRLGWCTVGVTLLEGHGFDHPGGGRALVVATGDMENTGMVWKDSTHSSVGSNWGRAPTLVEVVPATVTLPVPASRVQAWSLDGSGKRLQSVPVDEVSGRARLALGASGTTLWYEVDIASSGQTEAPRITREPLAVVAQPGGPVLLTAAAEGWPEPSAQWYHNGIALPAATGSSLAIASATAADTGDYRVEFSNGAGGAVSRTAQVVLATDPALAGSRLRNLSTRSDVFTGEGVMIAGFILSADKDVLVRGVGPELAASFGIAGALPDPLLELHRTGTADAIAANDSWDPAAVGDAFSRLGLFALHDPREAVLRTTLAAGQYTAILKDAGGALGNGLVEIYDAGMTEGGAGFTGLSTRAAVTESGLTVGFLVTGSAPLHVLIRGIGPALSDFGLTSFAADPVLTLHQITRTGPIVLARNDDWEDDDAAGVRSAIARTGVFALKSTSRDAAIELWLEPGLYTAVVDPKGAPGTGLVEVYQVP